MAEKNSPAWNDIIYNMIYILLKYQSAYDTVSANVMIWVPQMGESGQMVSEKGKWA